MSDSEEVTIQMPDQLAVGECFNTAKNHALCDGPIVIAHVLGAGYPLGKGWSPRTEAYTREIAHRYNTQPELLEALQDLFGDAPLVNEKGICRCCGRNYEGPQETDDCIDDCPGMIARAAIAKSQRQAA